LVLFYNNWDRASGSLNTVLTNRLGDFFLFIFFGGLGLLGFSFLLLKLLFITLLIFLVLGAFTKRAIFPFSGWLPKAIRAPTPVSALVHRRTLVTAGIILLLKFDLFLIHYVFSLLMMLFGLFTIFFSSLTALVEEDIKKVVALRTLSQIGFLIIILGLNYFFFCFLHLLRHALFKSCLFIQVGYIIHNYFSQQDSRNYFFNYYLPYYIQFQILITLFCLTGLFFSSGIVSKDIILESVASLNSIFYFFLILGVLLTFFYSFRLWLGLIKSFLGSMKLVETTKIFNLLSLPLFLFSLIFIFFLKLNYIFCPEFFLYLDFFIPLIYLILFIFLINYLIFFFFYYIFYKFLVDFFPKWITFKLIKNFKFFDLFLFKFFNMNLNFVFNLNFFFLGILKNLNWGTLIVFIVFLLLFF
jgi:NADH-ubiquinone oxidoreductase chain 5